MFGAASAGMARRCLLLMNGKIYTAGVQDTAFDNSFFGKTHVDADSGMLTRSYAGEEGMKIKKHALNVFNV